MSHEDSEEAQVTHSEGLEHFSWNPSLQHISSPQCAASASAIGGAVTMLGCTQNLKTMTFQNSDGYYPCLAAQMKINFGDRVVTKSLTAEEYETGHFDLDITNMPPDISQAFRRLIDSTDEMGEDPEEGRAKTVGSLKLSLRSWG